MTNNKAVGVLIFAIVFYSIPGMASPPKFSLSLFRVAEEDKKKGLTDSNTLAIVRSAVKTNNYKQVLPLLSSKYSASTRLAVINHLVFVGLKYPDKKLPDAVINKLYNMASSGTNIVLRAMAFKLLLNWEGQDFISSSFSVSYQESVHKILDNPDIQFLIPLWHLVETWSDFGLLSIDQTKEKVARDPNITIKITNKHIDIRDNNLNMALSLERHYIDKVFLLNQNITADSAGEKGRILFSTFFYLFHWQKIYQDLVFSSSLKAKTDIIVTLAHTPTDHIMGEALARELSNPKVMQQFLYDQYNQEVNKKPKTLDPKTQDLLYQFINDSIPKRSISVSVDPFISVLSPAVQIRDKIIRWLGDNLLPSKQATRTPLQQPSVIQAMNQLNNQAVLDINNEATQLRIASFLDPVYPMSVRLHAILMLMHHANKLHFDTVRKLILRHFFMENSHLVQMYSLFTLLLMDNKPKQLDLFGQYVLDMQHEHSKLNWFWVATNWYRYLQLGDSKEKTRLLESFNVWNSKISSANGDCGKTFTSY